MLREIYLTLFLSYTWYRALLFFYASVKKEKVYPEFKGKVSIVIPSYNESEGSLISLAESLLSATKDIDAEIIFADDGSNKKVEDAIKKLERSKQEKIKVLTFAHRGKRSAQIDALKHISGEVIVTLDSDILLEKNSISEIIKPFSDKKIGAVTGQVRILNEEQNWLTKATSTMYWNAFNVVRTSLSSFGVVNICSGALSAYRKEIFEKLSDEYLNQTFFGKQCVHGEDRALTNMILRDGYDVVYQKNSICYTVSPHTLKKFVKQQYRWRQSTVRETLIAAKFAAKRSKIFFIENLFLLTIPYINVVLTFLFFVFWITNLSLTPIILISILMVTLLHNMFYLLENPKKVLRAFNFTLLTYFVLVWLWPLALINVRKGKWGTR